jgi:hypothetical protein
MADFADRIRTRLVPALLTAAGVVLLAAGLFSFTNPVTADPVPPTSPSASADGSVVATPSPLITLPPLESCGLASPIPSVPADRVATRIRILALKIDLPIIVQPDPTYPACNVAMYLDDSRLGQPGEGRATYIYAHARTGMFLPLLTASKISNGKKMLGMVVEVWTSDDQRFLYVVTTVKRHVAYDNAVGPALAVESEQLWLQTSEGVGTQPKLQLLADPLSQEAAPHAEAHPVPKPVNCS